MMLGIRPLMDSRIRIEMFIYYRNYNIRENCWKQSLKIINKPKLPTLSEMISKKDDNIWISENNDSIKW